jgi:hypothetical protein
MDVIWMFWGGCQVYRKDLADGRSGQTEKNLVWKNSRGPKRPETPF